MDRMRSGSKIFISYSHAEQLYFEEFIKMLEPAVKQPSHA